MRVFVVGAALFLTLAAQAQDAAFEQQLAELTQNGQWHEALSRFHLSETAREGLSAQARYALGVSYMRVNRPELAEPLLKESRKSGLKGFAGWDGLEELLARALEVRRLLPPPQSDPWDSSAAPRIRVHAAEKLTGLPRVSVLKDIGRTMFSVDLPAVDLYVLPDIDKCARFQAALFGEEMARPDFHGGVNAVVLCRGFDQQFLPEALHPFGHAWVLSYLGSKHRLEPKRMRELWWLEEGLAAFSAFVVDPDFGRKQSSRVMARVAVGDAPPSLSELCDGAGTDELKELMASLLVAHLIGPDHPLRVRSVLDKLAQTDDAEAAFDLVVKKSPKLEYDRLVKSFWIDKEPAVPAPFARR